MSTSTADREKIQDLQGWTDVTLLELVLRFVDDENLGEKLAEFLEAVAAEENERAHISD
jgi:hypothetical protein